MSIISNRIDKVFRQRGNSCLLSSFAITGNYFLDEPVESFFKGYFSRFETEFNTKGVKFSWPYFEPLQGFHIIGYGARTKRSGYKILWEDLYESDVPIFKKCRDIFKCERISVNKAGFIEDGTFAGKKIDEVLETTESIINLFLNRRKNPDNTIWAGVSDNHSITVYFDGNMFYHDTNQPGIDLEIDRNWDWWNYYRTGDKMISWRDNQPDK